MTKKYDTENKTTTLVCPECHTSRKIVRANHKIYPMKNPKHLRPKVIRCFQCRNIISRGL